MKVFDRIGPEKLRGVLTDFYSRVFGDVMIGFLFEGKNRQQLIDREYEFTAQLLGGDVKYTGRPMRTAHGHLPIFGGHFERRMQILRETLRDHAIDAEVQRVWLEHSLALRPQITPDRGSECKDTAAAKLGPPTTPQHPDAPVKLGRRK